MQKGTSELQTEVTPPKGQNENEPEPSTPAIFATKVLLCL